MRLQNQLTTTNKENEMIEQSYKIASEVFEDWEQLDEDTQDGLAHEISMQL